MDQDVDTSDAAYEADSADARLVEETSTPFVGRWNLLVSHTNWEKGRIIHQWREALRESGAAAAEYSDDAWSRRVGGVTGQHAGRLRRVYQRFGSSHQDFDGLFWSHFQAAIEWTDAEMWLEGAVQNRWSVSQMRHQRWETLGKLDEPPCDADVVSSELDEDFEAAGDAPARRDASPSRSSVQSEPLAEGPDFGDEDRDGTAGGAGGVGPLPLGDEHQSAGQVDFVRPFAELAELPEDLAAAFEAFKLAILHHKLDEWQSISRDDVLASLDALKQLIEAP